MKKCIDISSYKKYIIWLFECIKEINDLNAFKPNYFPSISKYTAFFSAINECSAYEQNEENNGIRHINICQLLNKEDLSEDSKHYLLKFLQKICFYAGEYNNICDALYDSNIEDYLIQTGYRTDFLLTINDLYKENLNLINFYYITTKTIDDIPYPQYLDRYFCVSL